MPGPVSDSYDPEFGTGARAADVREALEEIDRSITETLGPALLDIVGVANSPAFVDDGQAVFGERDLRLIRFAVRRVLESI